MSYTYLIRQALDYRSNPTTINGSQTTYTTCTYDANGERLMRYNQTHYYYYYYDGVNLLFVKKDNAIDMRYLYDNEGNVYCAIASDNLPYWHHTDIRGSVTNVLKGDSGTSSSPTLIRSYLYNAYGDTNYTTFSGGETFNANPYLAYTGAILDQETGLYYLMSRYYDPKAGSFISQDSYKGEGDAFWHLYAYCDGDPVNKTDRNGKWARGVKYTITKRNHGKMWGWKAPAAYNAYATLIVKFMYKGKMVPPGSKSKKTVKNWKIYRVTASVATYNWFSPYGVGLNRLSITYITVGNKTYFKMKKSKINYHAGQIFDTKYIDLNSTYYASSITCSLHWFSDCSGGENVPLIPTGGRDVKYTIK